MCGSSCEVGLKGMRCVNGRMEGEEMGAIESGGEGKKEWGKIMGRSGSKLRTGE